MSIPIVTTPTIVGHEDATPLGIVSAQCAFGMNIFKDIATAWRDVVGGRAQSLQNTLSDSRKQALSELEAQAVALGATAVVGLDLDFTEFSSGGGMVIVIATGTAVRWGVTSGVDNGEPDYRDVIKAAIDAFSGNAPAALLKVYNGFERTKQIAGIRAAVEYVSRDIRRQANEAKIRFGSHFKLEVGYFMGRAMQDTSFPPVEQHFENLAAHHPYSTDEWEALHSTFITHFDTLTTEHKSVRPRYERVLLEIERGISMAQSLETEHGELLKLGSGCQSPAVAE